MRILESLGLLLTKSANFLKQHQLQKLYPQAEQDDQGDEKTKHLKMQSTYISLVSLLIASIDDTIEIVRKACKSVILKVIHEDIVMTNSTIITVSYGPLIDFFTCLSEQFLIAIINTGEIVIDLYGGGSRNQFINFYYTL